VKVSLADVVECAEDTALQEREMAFDRGASLEGRILGLRSIGS
jgi:hypothetical protein